MTFDPTTIGERASGVRYLPNKLHGDEIVGPSNVNYRQVSEGWLPVAELDGLLGSKSMAEVLLVDDTEGYPPVVYQVSRTVDYWPRVLKPLYLPASRLVDPDIGFALCAYRWESDEGRTAIVFRIEC